MPYFGCVGLGRRQSSKPVAAQESLNLTLFVEHGDPVLPGDDRQIQPLRRVGAWHQVARPDGICLN